MTTAEQRKIVEAAIRVWQECHMHEEAMRGLLHAVAQHDDEAIEAIRIANEP